MAIRLLPAPLDTPCTISATITRRYGARPAGGHRRRVRAGGPERSAGEVGWKTLADGVTAEESWNDEGKVGEYLTRVDRLDARRAGEAELVEAFPDAPERVLDLGCGDGRLTALVLGARPDLVEAVGLDVVPSDVGAEPASDSPATRG